MPNIFRVNPFIFRSASTAYTVKKKSFPSPYTATKTHHHLSCTMLKNFTAASS
jgi:hypothetical protein